MHSELQIWPRIKEDHEAIYSIPQYYRCNLEKIEDVVFDEQANAAGEIIPLVDAFPATCGQALPKVQNSRGGEARSTSPEDHGL